MFYSVIQIKGKMILTQAPYGDLQVFTDDFFDYEVKENDLVYLENGMFHYAEEATKRAQQENYDRMQQLFDK